MGVNENHSHLIMQALLNLIEASEPALDWGYGPPPADSQEDALRTAIEGAKRVMVSMVRRPDGVSTMTLDEFSRKFFSDGAPKVSESDGDNNAALIETREWVIDTRTSLMKLQDVVIGLLKRVQDLEVGK